MQLSRDYAMTRRITLKLYITLYSKSLNPTLHISPPSSVGSALDLKSKGRSIEVFTGEDQYSEWLNSDESNRVYWFETKFLVISLFVGCFYRKGPALNI